jgi:predicted house-cleaning noncanonical NTP pyrophosphatase (MazG superfamily)
MLVRDLIGEKLKQELNKVKNKEVEIVHLNNNDDFFDAIMKKIKSELDILSTTKSVDSLAEVMELIDWIQVSLGTSKIDDVIERRKEKLGLYWQRYYIRDLNEGFSDD